MYKPPFRWGQTDGDSIEYDGDIIVFYDQINDMIQNNYKKQGVDPSTLTFNTPHVFYPQTKMFVHCPSIGQFSQYYFIEDVEIFDKGIAPSSGRYLENVWYKITATKRNVASFSSQRKLNYLNFWGV